MTHQIEYRCGTMFPQVYTEYLECCKFNARFNPDSIGKFSEHVRSNSRGNGLILRSSSEDQSSIGHPQGLTNSRHICADLDRLLLFRINFIELFHFHSSEIIEKLDCEARTKVSTNVSQQMKHLGLRGEQRIVSHKTLTAKVLYPLMFQLFHQHQNACYI